MGGVSRNLIFEYFSKICRENSGFIKIGQERTALHVKTNIHFWSYLAHFFSEWEMFQTKVAEKIKTHILCSVTFSENRAIYETMWENIVERGHRWEFGVCALHARNLRLQTLTLTMCNTFPFSTATMVTRARLNVTLQYVHCLSCLHVYFTADMRCGLDDLGQRQLVRNTTDTRGGDI